jgi:hypothetical protein
LSQCRRDVHNKMILGFFQFFQIIKLSRCELLAYRDKRDIRGEGWIDLGVYAKLCSLLEGSKHVLLLRGRRRLDGEPRVEHQIRKGTLTSKSPATLTAATVDWVEVWYYRRHPNETVRPSVCKSIIQSSLWRALIIYMCISLSKRNCPKLP